MLLFLFVLVVHIRLTSCAHQYLNATGVSWMKCHKCTYRKEFGTPSSRRACLSDGGKSPFVECKRSELEGISAKNDLSEIFLACQTSVSRQYRKEPNGTVSALDFLRRRCGYLTSHLYEDLNPSGCKRFSQLESDHHNDTFVMECFCEKDKCNTKSFDNFLSEVLNPPTVQLSAPAAVQMSQSCAFHFPLDKVTFLLTFVFSSLV